MVMDDEGEPLQYMGVTLIISLRTRLPHSEGELEGLGS